MVKFEDSTTMLTLRLITEGEKLLQLVALTSAGLNNKASFKSGITRIIYGLETISKDSQEMRDDFVDSKK